jgi:hypothetical protein
VQLKIPTNKITDIDNLQNVLPTGSVRVMNADEKLNFSFGKALPLEVVDNFFVLEKGKPRAVELIDSEAKVRYRMTALTENIIGVQVYYPGQGPVVAIEMVTNMPDPREALWGKTTTGMQVLQPNEEAHYAYQIEVLPL